MPSLDLPTLPHLYRTADYGPDSAEARRLSRGAASGTLVAVHPGVYARAVDLADRKPEALHRLQVRAAMPSLGSRLVVSHESAAILHGLPALGKAPSRVHALDPASSLTRTSPRVVKHAGPLDAADMVTADGQRATSLPRTLVDVSLKSRFAVAVASLDRVLGAELVTADDIAVAFRRHPAERGRSRAQRALDFARGASGSPGESWCRCRLFEVGTPEPILQQEFRDAFGLIGFVDFWWPELGVILEFDGDVKYLDEELRAGLSAAEVALAERKRERRLLALPGVREVIRVEWIDLVQPWRLRAKLVAAGVPVR